MEPTCRINIVRLKGSQKKQIEDTLIEEVRFDIWLNGNKLIGLVATPIELEALAIGYLVSENIIERDADVSALAFSQDGMRIDIAFDHAKAESIERLTSEAVMLSGCGKGHASNIDPERIEKAVNSSSYTVDAVKLCNAMEGFLDHCKFYFETGAVHTAQLIFEDESYLVAEDIALHNAIDKVMGKAVMAGRDVSRAMLLLSGRLTSEMVAKSVMHGVPVVASRTAATCIGVKIAEKFGVTLAGFVRGDKMNLYAHPHRIIV